ncbi:MAG: long-chain fatty acid--CoA ligase [Desulfobulbus sp.]|nr:MAG: long-chain fatty acid--CoA ligase [Desulfobulbus sp.]
MFLRNRDKTALLYKGKEITYDALLKQVVFYSKLFPQSTQRVLIFSENRPEWIFCFYSAWKNASTVVPVDCFSTVDEVAYIIKDCTPEVFFCSRERETILRQVAESLDYTPLILVFEDISAEPGTSDDCSSADLKNPVMDDTALIIYTSGTTGSPKGVMLSYENVFANVEAVSIGTPILTSIERVLMLLPLHHIFPLIGTMVAPLSAGATVALCPSLKPEDIVNTLHDNRVTIIIGVPRLFKMICKGVIDRINRKRVARLLFILAEKANSRTLSRRLFKTVHKKFGGELKYLVCGGAALDPDTCRNFTTLGFEILEGYGMTEAAPMIAFTRPGQVTIGSAGTAMSCTDIEIRENEIVASGKNIMQGYYNRPEETAETLKDGWLYTGDLGHLDEKGRLFITGRKKEIIVLASGKNINPVLIEQKLEQLTDCINEVGVFVKDDILQAVIQPHFVKVRENGISDLEDHFRWKIIDVYNQAVSPSKRILKFTLINEELPKTRLSKLRRFQLPDLVGNREARKKEAEQPDFEEYLIIKGFIEKQTTREIYPDDHLEIDIAMDSLDQVSLLAFLHSTFGVELSEEKFKNHQTVRLLAEFVREKKEKISVELVNWHEILKEQVDLALPKTWVTASFFKNLSRIFFTFYFKFKGKGQENLPDTPCIIAPNHQSFYDAMFVASLLKNKFLSKTYFYAKQKHVKNKLLRFLADRNNIIVVDINSGLKESIQKLAEVLKTGRNIIIFPEGTRSKDGNLGDFKKLFAILSKELQVPVVPVTINGAYKALPTGSMIPKPFCPISVTFQPPVFPGEHTYESLTAQVFQKVEKELY